MEGWWRKVWLEIPPGRSRFSGEPSPIKRQANWRRPWWLPLPIVGLLLGVGGWLTDSYLQGHQRSVAPLELLQAPTGDIAVLGGRAILHGQRLSQVEVWLLEPVPRLLTFYWATTDPREIETALAAYFDQSPVQVRAWLRYEVR